MEFTLLWLIVAVLFLIVELSNPGMFYALAFALGCGAAMLTAACSDNVIVQMTVFLGATVGAMVLLRCFVARNVGNYHPSSNVYALVGKRGTVLIAPAGQQLGYVQLNGEMWACRAADNATITVDAQVIVVAVKGSHVIVRADS